MQGCVFCAIAQGRAPARVVLETAELICFFPLEPEIAGHTLIASRAHHPDMVDAPAALGEAVFKAAQLLASRYGNVLWASGFNLLHASGASAGQSVAHLHFHFMPRVGGDGLNLWPQLPGNDIDLDVLHRALREQTKGPRP